MMSQMQRKNTLGLRRRKDQESVDMCNDEIASLTACVYWLALDTVMITIQRKDEASKEAIFPSFFSLMLQLLLVRVPTFYLVKRRVERTSGLIRVKGVQWKRVA